MIHRLSCEDQCLNPYWEPSPFNDKCFCCERSYDPEEGWLPKISVCPHCGAKLFQFLGPVVGLDLKTDADLEDLLLDLCGRHELSNREVELLQAVEEERERRKGPALAG